MLPKHLIVYNQSIHNSLYDVEEQVMLPKDTSGRFKEFNPPSTFTKLFQGTNLVHVLFRIVFLSSSSHLSSKFFNKLSISTKGSVQLLHLPAVHHLVGDHHHHDN